MSFGVLWKEVSLQETIPFPTAYYATNTALSAFGCDSRLFMHNYGIICRHLRPVGDNSAYFLDVRGLCFSADNEVLYVACSSTHSIYAVDCKSGTTSIYAGNGQSGLKNGTLTESQFSSPGGLCLCSNGDTAVCDTGNHVIRRISSNGVSTLAGDGVPTNFSGLYDSASLFRPRYIHKDLDGGLLVVCDSTNTSASSVVAHIRTNGFIDIQTDCSATLIDLIPYPMANTYLSLIMSPIEPMSTVTLAAGTDTIDSFPPVHCEPSTTSAAPIPSNPKLESSTSAPTSPQTSNLQALPLLSISVENQQPPSSQANTTFACSSDVQTPLYTFSAMKRFMDDLYEAQDCWITRGMSSDLTQLILGVSKSDNLLLMVYDDCWTSRSGGRKQVLVERDMIVYDLLESLTSETGPQVVAELVLPSGEVVSGSAKIGEIIISVWLKYKDTVPVFTLSPKDRIHYLEWNLGTESPLTFETQVEGFTLSKLTQEVIDVHGFSGPVLLRRIYPLQESRTDAVLWRMEVLSSQTFQVTSNSCPKPVSVHLCSRSTHAEALEKISTAIGFIKNSDEVIVLSTPGEGPNPQFDLAVHSWPKCNTVHVQTAPAMNIFVKTLEGYLNTLKVHARSSILALKNQITELEQISHGRQLIFAGQRLTNEMRTLHDYNIQGDTTIHLVLRLDDSF